VYEVESDRRLEDLDYVCHQNEWKYCGMVYSV
jgi:hypothetical protein